MWNAMKSKDPLIPKKLAAKLRASYGRVFSGRDKIAYIEAKGRDILLELEEYELDPNTYAALHYPSVPDPLAYPTMTRIERLRDWLDDKAPKIPAYHEELLVAEARMESIESEVLAALSKMRVGTPGREPWPQRPATLQPLRQRWEREYSKQRKVSAKFREERHEKRAQEAERRKIERQFFMEEMARNIRLKASTMPTGKAVAYVSMMEVLQERLFGDPLSLADFYEIAQGQSAVMAAIIAEAETRAIQRLNDAGNATGAAMID